jgi:hypothetical protein
VALPLAVEPEGPGGIDALLNRAAEMRHALARHGAILFRGWGLSSLPDFQAFVRAFSGEAPLLG